MSITLDGTSGIVATGSLTGLTTPLAVNQGGTGLTTAGTSGNVLTSDGTNWTSSALPAGGVTSLNGQTGAITNTNYGSIGSYTVAFGDAATAYTTDDTINGASLVYVSTATYGAFNLLRQTTNASGGNVQVIGASTDTYTTLGLSGTWRCMTKGGVTPASGLRQLHLWVRIS